MGFLRLIQILEEKYSQIADVLNNVMNLSAGMKIDLSICDCDEYSEGHFFYSFLWGYFFLLLFDKGS